jgi:hypothetical protein
VSFRRTLAWVVSRPAPCCVFLPLVVACGGTLDAGSDLLQPALLPVSAQNPVIISNDGAYDNWQGEYALLLARGGSPLLAGIIVGAGGLWSDVNANLSAWQELVTRARDSGLTNVPDPIRSDTQPLRRPMDGSIDATVANASAGAHFIVDTSSALARPDRPVVVATGGRLTDVADAYLLDPTVTERVIVVSSLGTGFSEGEEIAHMGMPNGEMDAWADAIVVERFRYVQVSAYYDQTTDLPAERLPELPDNPLGEWMREKQPEILEIAVASDQVSVIAVALPAFTRSVTRVSQAGFDGEQPTLAPDPNGHAWLVTTSDGAAATAELWRQLLDPATFAP